jgi:hypothetical protein
LIFLVIQILIPLLLRFAYLRGKRIITVLIPSPIEVMRDHDANERAASRTSPLRGWRKHFELMPSPIDVN